MIAFCEKSTLEASPQTPKITQKGESLMAKLNRPVQIIFRVTEQEKEQIQERMKMCKIKNMACFLRMMAIMHIALPNGRFCGAKRPQCEAYRP